MVSKSVFFLVAFRVQPVREFRPVIRLDTFYGIWELFHHILQELCGGIRAVFFVCLENSEAAVLVYEGVLIEFLLCHFPRRDNSVEQISHLSGIFDQDMSSVHRVLGYISDLGA